MDHKKILASALGMSIVLALILLGTGNAAAGSNSTNRWASPLASAGGSGNGPNGGNGQTVKPPIQPSGSIAAAPSITITLGAWRNMRPTESTLNDLSLLPSSYSVDCRTQKEGWIVADSSTMLGYCNGVWDQAIVPLSTPENLMGVQAISPTLGVAVGQEGTILLYLYDYSANNWVWTKYPIPVGSAQLNSVSMVKHPNGTYVGWAVGLEASSGGKPTLVRGTIARDVTAPLTTTYISDWTNVTSDYTLPAAYSLWMVQTLAPNDAWAVGSVTTSSGGVIVHWNGTTWSVVQNVPETLHAIKMKSASEGWAVGRNGATYRYNGATWTKVPTTSTKILHGIDYGPDGTPWAVGYENTLLNYVGGGWQPVPTLYSDAFDFRGVDFTSGHGWLVGTHYSKNIGGQILEYENGLWLPVTMPTDNRLNAVSTVSENDAWAVGAPDSNGGTIIHWDGSHWLRWFQRDLPIPSVELRSISMASSTDGWAAGDPVTTGGNAVLLHWDGRRWAPPRYNSPINAVPINGLDVYRTGDNTYPVFAWAVADNGDQFAKYQSNPDYWTGLHSCDGIWYRMFGVSIIPGGNQPGDWDAWAVGKQRSGVSPYTPIYGVFNKFQECYPGTGNYAWKKYQVAPYTIYPGNLVNLYGIKMTAGSWGFAGGDERLFASIWSFNSPYNTISNTWELMFQRPNDDQNPSTFYSVGIDSSQVAWLGGYFSNPEMGGKKWAYLNYIDATGRHPVPANRYIYPRWGINVYHRPIRSIQMGNETMGWAVGDPEDTSDGGKGDIYMYPFPNFTLSTSPAARAMLPTASKTFTVKVNSLGGFSGDVTFSFPEAFPAGITASVNPVNMPASSTATVTVTTSGAAVGAYCIKLRGYSAFWSGDALLPVKRDVCLNVYVTNRPVDSVSPDHGPYGTVVTITGTGFGADPGDRSSASNHVSWGTLQIANADVLSWSNTVITFRPPDSPGSFTEFPNAFPVKVTAGGLDSNNNLTFRMDPWITNISAVAGSGVQTITVTGTSFGNDPGLLSRATMFEHVAVNGITLANSSIVSWSNHTIVFTVPLSSLGGLVTVTSNGFESNAVGFGSVANRDFLPLLRR